MITKSESYGPCENMHTEENIPVATHEVSRGWQGIFASMLVCAECAERYERQGWTATELRQPEEEVPYREEWEKMYGRLPSDQPTIHPEAWNPFN